MGDTSLAPTIGSDPACGIRSRHRSHEPRTPRAPGCSKLARAQAARDDWSVRRVVACLLVAAPLTARADTHHKRRMPTSADTLTDDEKARAALAVIDGTAWVDDAPSKPPATKAATPNAATPATYAATPATDASTPSAATPRAATRKAATPKAARRGSLALDDSRAREDREDARRIASRLQPWRASILDGRGTNGGGLAAGGGLTDGERLEAGDGYYLRRPQRAYGAPAVVEYVRRAVAEVRAAYPDVHDLAIGDLSAEHGGALAGHVSHRTGHDVDVGFYFRHAPHGFEEAGGDLDLAATWALVTAFARTRDASDGVQIMFLDYGVQRRLYEWAHAHGVDEDELARVLQYPAGRDAARGLVRHWPNHANHLHVRFKVAR